MGGEERGVFFTPLCPSDRRCTKGREINEGNVVVARRPSNSIKGPADCLTCFLRGVVVVVVAAVAVVLDMCHRAVIVAALFEDVGVYSSRPGRRVKAAAARASESRKESGLTGDDTVLQASTPIDEGDVVVVAASTRYQVIIIEEGPFRHFRFGFGDVLLLLFPAAAAAVCCWCCGRGWCSIFIFVGVIAFSIDMG